MSQEQQRKPGFASGYFRRFTARDVEAALADFEHSLDVLDRWEASAQLISYFTWCWNEGIDVVPGGGAVNDYVVRFARKICFRIAGRNDREEAGWEPPMWAQPNVVFGWQRPPHRPREDNWHRDLAIAAYVERLRRQGADLVAAKQRAATKFGLAGKTATVQKALRLDPEIKRAFGPKLSKVPIGELKEIVDGYFEALAEGNK